MIDGNVFTIIIVIVLLASIVLSYCWTTKREEEERNIKLYGEDYESYLSNPDLWDKVDCMNLHIKASHESKYYLSDVPMYFYAKKYLSKRYSLIKKFTRIDHEDEIYLGYAKNGNFYDKNFIEMNDLGLIVKCDICHHNISYYEHEIRESNPQYQLNDKVFEEKDALKYMSEHSDECFNVKKLGKSNYIYCPKCHTKIYLEND